MISVVSAYIRDAGCIIRPSPGPETATDEFAQSHSPSPSPRIAPNAIIPASPQKPDQLPQGRGDERSPGKFAVSGATVAAQLRNRTMAAGSNRSSPKMTGLPSSATLESTTAYASPHADAGDYAGAVALAPPESPANTAIRSATLLGVDYNVSEIFPADGTGGAGFDTNGETLYIPPMLLERYHGSRPTKSWTARSSRRTWPRNLAPNSQTPSVLNPGKELAAPVSIYVSGDYTVRVLTERKESMGSLFVEDR